MSPVPGDALDATFEVLAGRDDNGPHVVVRLSVLHDDASSHDDEVPLSFGEALRFAGQLVRAVAVARLQRS